MALDRKEVAQAVIYWLRHDKDEERMIQMFEERLKARFGLDPLKSHVDRRSEHYIAHDLVMRGKLRVLEHLVATYEWDINVQRANDLSTPLHLARWYSKHHIADRLLEMKADTSIKNSYEEDAEATRLKDKPIRALLRGASSTQDILQLVDSKLGSFDIIDKIAAYTNLAEQRSSEVEPKQLGSNPSFRKLAGACVKSLRRVSGPESGKCWASMLRGLARLPDPGVVKSLADLVQAKGLPLDAWGGDDLAQVAQDLAKIKGGSDLWAHSYEALGSKLSRCISQMQEKHISMAVWAFGKAGAHAKVRRFRHPELFEAVARHLEERGDSMGSPQMVSNIAWGFAKLGECHQTAFSRLAVVASPNVERFDGQHVANTAWAYAKLGLAEETLFCALMRRADTTLYEERPNREKYTAWRQVYEAYCFCCESCPEAIAVLTRRLATDLQKIDVQDWVDGLSEGSGLESADDLKQLDEMMAAEQEDFDVAATGDGNAAPLVPPDSLEALMPAEPLLQRLKLVVLQFQRRPECFRQALLEGPELKPCRDALEAANLGVHLPGGPAKIFVRPEHYNAVRHEVVSRGMKLVASLVLVAEEFEEQVLQALEGIRSSDRVVMRDRSQLTATVFEDIGRAWHLRVKHSFFHIDVPESVSIARHAATA